MTLIRYLHLLSMVFFVGGSSSSSWRSSPRFARNGTAMTCAIARRFGWGTLAAIAVLIGTGIPLASHFHQWESSTLHLKLGSSPPWPGSSRGTCVARSYTRSRAGSS